MAEIEAPNYIIAGDMSVVGGITGAPIVVQTQGCLRMEIAWANTGTPVGTLTLEFLALDGSWKTIPDAGPAFTTQPNNNTVDLVCYWFNLQGYTQVRLRYTRSSGGTANTSFTARYRTS